MISQWHRFLFAVIHVKSLIAFICKHYISVTVFISMSFVLAGEYETAWKYSQFRIKSFNSIYYLNKPIYWLSNSIECSSMVKNSVHRIDKKKRKRSREKDKDK